jgi:hypothetical protein
VNTKGDTDSARWPPKRCDMPDLSKLSAKLTIDHTLNWTFRGVGLQMDGPGQAQFLNLVRLVDKTLLEYENARQYLQRYLNSHNQIGLFMRCVDHMENCVDSLNRVLSHLEGLRTSLHREQSRSSEPLPQIAREDIPSSTARKRINEIRDGIQHMDDRITKGRAGRDIAPIGLVVKSDSIELDNKEIYFVELAHWIEQVYAITERLVGYTPSS